MTLHFPDTLYFTYFESCLYESSALDKLQLEKSIVTSFRGVTPPSILNLNLITPQPLSYAPIPCFQNLATSSDLFRRF